MGFLLRVYRFSTTWTGVVITVLGVLFFVGQGFIIPSRSMLGTLHEGDVLFVKKFSYGITIPKLPWVELPLLPDFRNDGHLISGARPSRGDIVVFNPPKSDRVYFVKRAFAVGGDKVIFTKDGMYLRPFEGDAYIGSHFKNYELATFFGELYVKEPYAVDFHGIRYGGDNPPFSSFYVMRSISEMTQDRVGVAMDRVVLENGDVAFYTQLRDDHFFMVGDNRDNSDDSRMWGSIDYSRVVGKPWFSLFSITLEVSNEVDAKNNPYNRYVVRWNRMFKSADSLQRQAEHLKLYASSCRPYHDVCENVFKDL